MVLINYASFGGVILISVSDSSLHPELHVAPHTFHPRPVIGDILALLSSFFYAIYMVYLKVQIKDESRIDMQLFFGFVGLFSMFLCWPVVPLLHVLGVESFELPNTRQAMVAILINVSILSLRCIVPYLPPFTDVHYILKRLYLRYRHAQNYTASGNRWHQPDDPISSRMRFFVGQTRYQGSRDRRSVYSHWVYCSWQRKFERMEPTTSWRGSSTRGSTFELPFSRTIDSCYY